MAAAQGTKPAKKASAPKKTKSAPSHPPYIEMIKEALVSLKERSGSSTYAIAKHIEEQQKVRDLPPNFRKVLATQLKKFVASGKLVKIKNSFKLAPTAAAAAKKSAPAETKDSKPKPKSKEAAPKKKTTTVSKPKSKETATKKKTTTAAKPKPAAAKKVTAKKPAKSPVKKAATKKVVAAKVKKAKSVKSPAKKAPAAKKAKK